MPQGQGQRLCDGINMLDQIFDMRTDMAIREMVTWQSGKVCYEMHVYFCILIYLCVDEKAITKADLNLTVILA